MPLRKLRVGRSLIAWPPSPTTVILNGTFHFQGEIYETWLHSLHTTGLDDMCSLDLLHPCLWIMNHFNMVPHDASMPTRHFCLSFLEQLGSLGVTTLQAPHYLLYSRCKVTVVDPLKSHSPIFYKCRISVGV